MKRNFNCSDSLTHFLSHPLEDEMKGEDDCIYKEAETDAADDETTAAGGEKKRRLSNHQVKSLEKIFEVDNKLDPDRKVKVAQDLGLQPRQVAIWFQNRRARWKTKQLERDYNLLKSNYDLLKHNYHKLEHDNQSLTKQLEELKSKLHEETTEGEEDEGDYDDESKYNRDNVMFSGSDPSNTNHEVYTRLLNYEKSSQVEIKDGLSDSDSSGVLNDTEINMNLSSNSSSNGGIMASFGVSNSRLVDHGTAVYEHQQQSDPYSVGDDESCNIFLVDQAPNLCWYFRDHLN